MSKFDYLHLFSLVQKTQDVEQAFAAIKPTICILNIYWTIIFAASNNPKGEPLWKTLWARRQEGHDGPVSLSRLICKISSYQTLKYLGIGLKHNTP